MHLEGLKLSIKILIKDFEYTCSLLNKNMVQGSKFRVWKHAGKVRQKDTETKWKADRKGGREETETDTQHSLGTPGEGDSSEGDRGQGKRQNQESQDKKGQQRRQERVGEANRKGDRSNIFKRKRRQRAIRRSQDKDKQRASKDYITSPIALSKGLQIAS